MVTEDKKPSKMKFRELLVNKWLSRFIETQNPLFVWRCYQTARYLKTEIPEEVLSYFDQAAENIIKLALNTTAKAKPADVAKAVGLSEEGAGPGSALSDFLKWETGRRMAIETHTEIESAGPGKANLAHETVAKRYKISESKVRRNYLSHLERWTASARRSSIAHSASSESQAFVVGHADDLRETAIILEMIEKEK